MGLFGMFGKEKDERKAVKREVDKLMRDYDKEKIDGQTYMSKMMDLTTSHKKKHR